MTLSHRTGPVPLIMLCCHAPHVVAHSSPHILPGEAVSDPSTVWRDSIKLIRIPPLPQLPATRAQPPSLSRRLEDRHPFQSLPRAAPALRHSLLQAPGPIAKAMVTQISMSTPHFVQPPPIKTQYPGAGWSSGSGTERWPGTWGGA